MSEKTPDERKAEAAARKAEAEAKKAEAEAKKAEQERAEWEGELERQVREATSRKTIAEADEAVRSAGQTLSDNLAQQKLEAEAKKAIAEADKAVSDAQTAQVSALIPDFSKIEKGATTVKGDQAVFGSLLGRMALEKAAAKVVEKLQCASTDVVLITTDADLASTDAVHLEVVTGLDTLTEAANELLTLLEKPGPAESFAIAASSVVGAIASAAPGLLSLFSANRALSSFASSADTTAALAAVASGLTAKTKVQIDDFRLVQGGRVVAKEKKLREERSKLIKRKLDLEEAKTNAIKRKKAATDAIAALKKQLAGLSKDDPKKSELEEKIELQEEHVDMANNDERDASVAIPLVGQLVTGIDTFLASLHTIPSGGKRSPFAIAALRQQLHAKDGEQDPPTTFTKVLFLEASAGAVDQLLNDRPLWFKDKLHSIGSVAITYWLLDTSTSNIETSGVASGTAEMKGKIGDEIKFVTVGS